MNKNISLTTRLSLLFASSAAIVLLVSGMLFVRAGENQFLVHDSEELNGKMELIRNELGRITTPEAISTLHSRLRDTVLGHPGISISVVAIDGAIIFSTGSTDVVNHLVQGAEIGKQQPVTWQFSDQTYRIVTNRFALGIPHTQPANVAIALDITDDQEFMSAFRQFLWFGMSLATLAMGWLGWVVVRKGLAPLDELSSMIANISAHRLDKPLPTEGVPRELQELVRAFNSMLTRLDESFQRLSYFSSDIAHELRTPVSNLMIQTQVTLSRDRDSVDYRNTLQSNLEEFERLSRMISDMLFLAKADNKLVVLNRESFELQKEVERVREFYEALASEHGIQITQSGAATISADRLMMQRALSNLISNAIRFTPEKMAIEVSINEDAEWVTLVVANPGPAIPAEHLPNIFERLYRVDASRREGTTDNVGLGLAITRSIVEMHGGNISAESVDGRTYFKMKLPR